MAFSPKQMLYLLSRVKRGVRPKFARPLKAVQETGGRYGTVDMEFTEPFRMGQYGTTGVSRIVTANRNRIATANWELMRNAVGEGKHRLHFSGIEGPGASALGAANVKRLLGQFKGYMQGQFSRITGHRVTGVRRRRAQSMGVNVPGKGLGRVVNPRIGAPVQSRPWGVTRTVGPARWQQGVARTVEPPRPAVPDWNPPSINEMKAGTARMPETWGHRHAQRIAAEIREWAMRTNQVGSEAHHRFVREAARQLRATGNRAFQYEDFFRAAMTGSERRPPSTSRVTGRGYLRRRRT